MFRLTRKQTNKSRTKQPKQNKQPDKNGLWNVTIITLDFVVVVVVVFCSFVLVLFLNININLDDTFRSFVETFTFPSLTVWQKQTNNNH